jgi:hypothetical protein
MVRPFAAEPVHDCEKWSWSLRETVVAEPFPPDIDGESHGARGPTAGEARTRREAA